MQENEVKKSLIELRQKTGETYNSMSKGAKGSLIDTIMAKFGDARNTWQHRLAWWAGGPEYSGMNEYLEREVHKFIDEVCKTCIDIS